MKAKTNSEPFRRVDTVEDRTSLFGDLQMPDCGRNIWRVHGRAASLNWRQTAQMVRLWFCTVWAFL
jgi:hypothetical protein